MAPRLLDVAASQPQRPLPSRPRRWQASVRRGRGALLPLAAAACATAGTSDQAAAGFDRRWLVVAAVVVVLTPLLLLQHRRNQRRQARHHRREQILTDLTWLLDDLGPPPDTAHVEVYATDVRNRGQRLATGLAELAEQGPEPVTAAATHLASRVDRLTSVLLARLDGPNDPQVLAARAEDLCRQTREGASALRRALDAQR